MTLLFFHTVLVPLCICVVLPVMIVWLICGVVNNKVNRRAEVITEVIKTKPDVDADELIKSLADHQISPAHLFHLRLLRGCIFSLVGLVITLFFLTLSYKYDWDDKDSVLILPGLISMAIGIAYLIVCYVIRKTSADNSGSL